MTANIVAPGIIAAERLEHIPERVFDGTKERGPVGRLGGSDEVARVVHFLVADQSSFIARAICSVNGGMDM